MLSSTRNLLIMNMAVAGILLCSFTMPLTLLDQLHTNWVFGESRVIKIWFLTKNYLKLIANNASIFHCTKDKLVNTNRNNVLLLKTHYRPNFWILNMIMMIIKFCSVPTVQINWNHSINLHILLNLLCGADCSWSFPLCDSTLQCADIYYSGGTFLNHKLIRKLKLSHFQCFIYVK